MTESRSRFFANLAANIDSSGGVTEAAIATGVSLGGARSYDSAAAFPASSQTGDLAFDASTNHLFLRFGTGWFNVGLINLDPRIVQGVSDSSPYALDSAGGDALSLNLIAQDSDGTAIYWSYTTSDSAHDLATIANDSNGTFTVAAKSLADILAAGYDSSGGEFSITFKASDGIGFDTDSATFTLTYAVAAVTKIEWDTTSGSMSGPTPRVYSINSTQAGLYDVYFKPDGLAYYAVGQSPDAVSQFSMATPYDISTSTHVATWTTAPVDTGQMGIYFKPDGSKMYIASYISDAIREYDLSTPWDITTATYLQAKTSLSSTDNPTGVWFSFEGDIMLVSFDNAHKIIKYTLSTPWDVTTATLSQTKTFSSTIYPQGVYANPQGTEIWYVDSYGADLRRMLLSTPFDLSSVTIDVNRVGINDDTVVTGLGFAWDGTIVFPTTNGSDMIHKWYTGI